MVSSIQWMKNKFYLKRNPFPSGAILAVGSAEASESGLIYNPKVNPSEIQEYIEKFVIKPSLSKGSGLGALWSMGTKAPTSEARGYGKSSLGLYVAREICKDFGKSILEANKITEETQQPLLIGSYATFKKQVDTGFNAIAFRHVEWLAQPQQGWYTESPLYRLRKRILKSLPATYSPGSPDEREAIVKEIKTFRALDQRFKGSMLAPLDQGLLSALSSNNPTDVVSYLHEISPYSIWRNGFVYLDTALTFAMRAGVTKAILFMDQVEDFASPDTPRNKRLKEVERFRDIIKETCPFNSVAFFIITMHPRARTQIWDLWRDARLPSIDPVELGGARENSVRVKILREITEFNDAKKLLESYLEHEEYRLAGRPSPLHPFTEHAVRIIMETNGGRPGYMLSHSRDILDLAAEQNLEIIDADFVKGIEPKLPAEERVKMEGVKEEGPPKYLK